MIDDLQKSETPRNPSKTTIIMAEVSKSKNNNSHSIESIMSTGNSNHFSPKRRCTEPVNKVSVILGAQWGDEGKGKLVDLLATEADIVCRCAVSL